MGCGASPPHTHKDTNDVSLLLFQFDLFLLLKLNGFGFFSGTAVCRGSLYRAALHVEDSTFLRRTEYSTFSVASNGIIETVLFAQIKKQSKASVLKYVFFGGRQSRFRVYRKSDFLKRLNHGGCQPKQWFSSVI